MSSSQQQPKRMAEAIYEPREYPDCPEGEYVAICAKSELRPAKATQYNPEGLDKINTRWEILKDAITGEDVFYVDETDAEKKNRHYQVFGQPMSQSFGPRSNVNKLFVELTGVPVDFMVQKVRENRMFGNVEKSVNVVRFDPSIFEGMMAVVKVTHDEYTDSSGNTRIGVNVSIPDSIKTTPKQKWNNYCQFDRMPGRPEFPAIDLKKLQATQSVPMAPAAREIFGSPMPAQQGAPVPVPMPMPAQQPGQQFRVPVPPPQYSQQPGPQGYNQPPVPPQTMGLPHAPTDAAANAAAPFGGYDPNVSPQGTRIEDLPAAFR